MSKFKYYVTMDCVSFTILVLLFTILTNYLDVPSIDTSVVVVLFSMTTCIAVLISLTDRLAIGNTLLSMAIDLADVIAVVFLIGGIGGFIPMQMEYVLIVLMMILIVYFVTFAILVIKNKADAEDINKKINEIKGKK